MKKFSIVSSVILLHIFAFVMLVNGCSTKSHRTSAYRQTHPYADIGEPTSNRPMEPQESDVVSGEPIMLDEPEIAQEPVAPAPAPDSKPAPAAEPAGNGEKIYIVKQNDMLYTIAKHHGVTINAICERNGFDKNKVLRIGQKLVIPAPQPKKDEPAKSSNGVASGKIYVVKNGDVLGKIAREQGVTVKAIMEANNLKNANNIRVGQKLVIPEKAAKTDAKSEPKKSEPKKAEPAKTEPKAEPVPAKTEPAPEPVPAKAETPAESVPANPEAPTEPVVDAPVESVPAESAPVESVPEEPVFDAPVESTVE